MESMTSLTIIQRSGQAASRLFEGQMLVITSDDSMLHRLNEVGTFIWQFLDAPRSIEEICAAIEQHFSDFDRNHNREEIIHFIVEMREKHLITAGTVNE